MHGSLEMENNSYGRPLGKSDHSVLKMDYIVKSEVLKGEESTLSTRKFIEENMKL